MAKKTSSKKVLKNSTSGRKNLQDPAIVEKKNRRDLSKSTSPLVPLMEKEVYKAIDWLREGKTTDAITNELRSTINPRTKRKYASRFVENIVTTANQLIQMWYRNQIYQIQHVHTTRYNKIIISRLNKTYGHIDKPWIAIKAESMHLDEILQALKQKEVLLGMHRKTFRLIFNSQTNFYESERQKRDLEKNPREKKKEINLDLLTFEEKVELLDLIRESTRTEDEIHGVILKNQITTQEVIEVEAEVVEPANVDKIERFISASKIDDQKGSILFDIKKKLELKSAETNRKKR